MGAMNVAEWKSNVETAALISKDPKLALEIGALSNIFTNELIDEINDFDKAAIVRQAQGLRL